jgi:hypothetical protein
MGAEVTLKCPRAEISGVSTYHWLHRLWMARNRCIDPATKAGPPRFSLSLSGLPPGRHACQVTVLNPSAQKTAFWRADIVLIP